MLKEMINIPIKTASQVLGVSEQFIRIGLQQKTLPIGSAVKMSSKWTYHISYKLLKDYVGEERIKEYEKGF